MHKVFYLVLLPLISTAVAAEEVKPVFQAEFDNDFQAVTSTGTVAGKHSQNVNAESLSTLLQQGIKGKAAKVGVELVNGKGVGSSVRYPADFVKPEAGTIAFWLKPIDWDFSDKRFHTFCEVKGPEARITVYKADKDSVLFLFGTWRKNAHVVAYAPAGTWKKGEFHHIAAAWDEKTIFIYTDGVLRSTRKIREDAVPKEFKELTIGPASARAWKNPMGDALISGNMLIDDVRIYDRPLSKAEVKTLFSSYGVSGKAETK